VVETFILAFSNPPYWVDICAAITATLTILFCTAGLSWKDFMAFASEMDAVGRALGWHEPEKIDLFKTTKAAQAAGRPDLPMGVYYY
jgi:hypothetical protein